MIIRGYEEKLFEQWQEMRLSLWPEASVEEHQDEMNIIASGKTFDAELAWLILFVEDKDQLIGFIECSLRETFEYSVKGPVGYIEGWYVDSDYRQKGVGTRLVVAAETWAKEQGCGEMASDVEFENENSLLAHERLGYRVVGKNDESNILLRTIKIGDVVLKKKTYNKLVRDLIPEIIEQTGKKGVCHTAKGKEYQIALLNKLREETEEFIENPCEEEMADIYEVMDSLIELYKFTDASIRTVQKEKRASRGGFSERYILEYVETKED